MEGRMATDVLTVLCLLSGAVVGLKTEKTQRASVMKFRNADQVVNGVSAPVVTWGTSRYTGLQEPEDGWETQEFVKPTEIQSEIMGGCLTTAVTGPQNTIYVTCEGEVFVSGTRLAENGDFNPDSSEARAITHVTALKDHFVMAASLGDSHFVALTSMGAVFAWGDNEFGQIAMDANTPYSTTPREITSVQNINVRFVHARSHRSALITDLGDVYLFGKNVGPGGSVLESGNAYRPHRVTSLSDSICQVSMGDTHVAAVSRGGDLYTWGDGTAGQLGLGDFNIKRQKPSRVNRLKKNVCFVEASGDYTAAVSRDARMFLWGSKAYSSPFEKIFLTGTNYAVQAGAGQKHMVVLMKNGTAVTWGSSKKGQIGRDDPKGTFTVDAAELDWTNQSFSAISVGGDQTVAISSGIPAPSLCPCNGGFSKYWYEEAQYQPTCTATQISCGDQKQRDKTGEFTDGSCCGHDQTCCRVSDDVTVLFGKRSMESESETKSSFVCTDGRNNVCCGQTGQACPVGFLCKYDSGDCNCVPANKRDMTPMQLAGSSRSCISQVPGPAKASGKQPGEGKCGKRKTTCLDGSCCNKGFTCCQSADGSGYGCCEAKGGVCCAQGCCQAGYVCGNSVDVCVKAKPDPRDDTRLVLHGSTKRVPVKSQCGDKTRCPDLTCCKKGKKCCQLGDGAFGCCPFRNGKCCADGAGCCPAAYSCDVLHNMCVNGPGGDEQEMSGTPRNTAVRSDASILSCGHTGSSGEEVEKVCDWPGTCSTNKERCCPFQQAVFCPGTTTCCPTGWSCDHSGNRCQSGGDASKPKDDPVNTGVSVSFIARKVTQKTRTKLSWVKAVSSGQAECEPGEKLCEDGKWCCPRGNKCCTDPDGAAKCCKHHSGTACKLGCCALGYTCDETSGTSMCRMGESLTHHLPTTVAKKPKPTSGSKKVVDPQSCFNDEKKCSNGECCTLSSSCCSFGLGEYGCCPQTHSKCCARGADGGGGCCPGGSTCPDEDAPAQCRLPGGKTVPMITSDPQNSPSVQSSEQECWSDEMMCMDGSCCKTASQTCCTKPEPGGKTVSVCCEAPDAVCCGTGACCLQGWECSADGGCIPPPSFDWRDLPHYQTDSRDIVQPGQTGGYDGLPSGGGQPYFGSIPMSPPVGHPVAQLPDADCPDGTTCAKDETCCSLGMDDAWDEEIFSCCPEADGVCCENGGCCPNGAECGEESNSCLLDGRNLPMSELTPSEQPPPFVCLLPDTTQCPNSRCCTQDEVCVELASGNYNCVSRGFEACQDARWACPAGLVCDMDTAGNQMMCSEIHDNDPQIKDSLLRAFWGDPEPPPEPAKDQRKCDSNDRVCDDTLWKMTDKLLKNLPPAALHSCKKAVACVAKDNREDCDFCTCLSQWTHPPGPRLKETMEGFLSCRPSEQYCKTIEELYYECHGEAKPVPPTPSSPVLRLSFASAKVRTWADECSLGCTEDRYMNDVSLLQTFEATHDDLNLGASHSPEVDVPEPPQTLFWYPKKLTPVSRAVRTTSTSLPEVSVGKICQHNITRPVSRSDSVESQFMKMLTSRTEAEIRAGFNAFDSNNDGEISTEELKVLLQHLHPDFDPPDELLNQLISRFDKDLSGKVSLQETLIGVRALQAREKKFLGGDDVETRFLNTLATMSTEELRAGFNAFNKNEDSGIDAEELKFIIRALNPGFDPPQSLLDKLISRFDFDNNGQVSMQEVMVVLKKGNDAEEAPDTEKCHVSNLNGHFLSTDRERVGDLLNEYFRRQCEFQDCLAPKATKFVFEPEDLDPCPCREKPDLSANERADESAGSMGVAAQEAEIQEVASIEQETSSMAFKGLSEVEEAFVEEVKPAEISSTSTLSGGAKPVMDDIVVDGVEMEAPIKSSPMMTSRSTLKKKIQRTLVRPTSDKMQLAGTFLDSAVSNAHGVADAMATAEHSPKKQMMADCAEDATESAVDLDGKVATAEDAAGEAVEALDISLAQMNAFPLKGSKRPDQFDAE